MVSTVVYFLNAYSGCIASPTLLYLGLCFRPWISLPTSLCLVSTAFTELEIQRQCDRSQPKPHSPSQAHGTIISLERSCWFF